MIRDEKGRFVKGENIVDLSEKRFGKLTVLQLDKDRTKRKSYWICRCDCGNIKSIRADSLKIVTSCGCVKKEQDLNFLEIPKNNHFHLPHLVQ